MTQSTQNRSFWYVLPSQSLGQYRRNATEHNKIKQQTMAQSK